MLPLLESYFDRLTMLHDEIKKALDALPPEALDWSPGAGLNSVTVLLTHVAGSERYWIGEIAGGDPAQRDRPAEFQVVGVDAMALKQRLDEVLAHSRQTLEKLTLADLGVLRENILRKDTPVMWALMQSLQHTASHLGHVEVMRDWWKTIRGE